MRGQRPSIGASAARLLHRLPGTFPTLTTADCCPSAARCRQRHTEPATRDARRATPVRPASARLAPSGEVRTRQVVRSARLIQAPRLLRPAPVAPGAGRPGGDLGVDRAIRAPGTAPAPGSASPAAGCTSRTARPWGSSWSGTSRSSGATRARSPTPTRPGRRSGGSPRSAGSGC
jgi:hypothetical protein